jgi:hypothetical protein
MLGCLKLLTISVAHTLDLFHYRGINGQKGLVNMRIWFDDMTICTPAGAVVPIDEFVAGCKRWCDALYKSHPEDRAQRFWAKWSNAYNLNQMCAETRPQVQPPPPPWKKLQTWPVGGLFQVGYAEGSDLLLVLSWHGRGIFNCLTGEKVARDYAEAHDSFDPVKLTAQGFGPLEGQTVPVVGSFGGELPHATADGWVLEEQSPAWPIRSILLNPSQPHNSSVVADDGAYELHAFGFSETGLSFVIATSSDLTIFMRPG